MFTDLKIKDVYSLFAITNKEIIPKKFRLLIPDIDGTLMNRVVIERPMVDKIKNLASVGVHQRPITGRGATFIAGLFGDIIPVGLMDMFKFYAEYGLVEFDLKSKKSTITERLDKNHPIFDPAIRQGLANLVYKVGDLERYLPGQAIPSECYVMTDPKGEQYLAPKSGQVEYPFGVWDDAKTVMMTIAMMKGQDGLVLPSATENQEHLVELIKKYLVSKKADQWIEVIPATSATDLLPKIRLENGEFVTFDKDVAAGNAILDFANLQGIDPVEACKSSIAFGDSGTDIRFSVPIIDSRRHDVAMFFVGPKKYFTPKTEQELGNIAAVSLDTAGLGNAFGPEVTMAMLDYLDNRI
jgi:hypothetical protein